MFYSEFNSSLGAYKVYKIDVSQSRFLPTPPDRKIGVAPQEISSELPAGSEYVGLSEEPIGIVIDSKRSVLGDILVTVAAIIIAKMIYK